MLLIIIYKKEITDVPKYKSKLQIIKHESIHAQISVKRECARTLTVVRLCVTL